MMVMVYFVQKRATVWHLMDMENMAKAGKVLESNLFKRSQQLKHSIFSLGNCTSLCNRFIKPSLLGTYLLRFMVEDWV